MSLITVFFISARLLLLNAQSSAARQDAAKSAGPQSPAIAGNNNTVIYENNTQVIRAHPSASNHTKVALRSQAKTYLGAETAWDGLLSPSHDQTPASKCSVSPEDFGVLLGDGPTEFTCSSLKTCILLSGESKNPGVLGPNDPSVLLSLMKSGPIYVLNGKLLGPEGSLIALFRGNKIYTNRLEVSLVERPDPSSISILNLRGEIIFNLRFLNARTMSLSGTFYSAAGDPVILNSDGMFLPRSRDQIQNACFHNDAVGLVF